MNKPLLIGAGNRWRRDDGIGHWLVDRLLRTLGDAVDAIQLSGEGAGLIDAWQGRDRVWLFDAGAPAGHPGRVTRIAAHVQHVPSELCHHSTHRFGVGEAIEMARALAQLPNHLLLIAVEGKDFGQGKGLSDVVLRETEPLIRILEAEIRGAL